MKQMILIFAFLANHSLANTYYKDVDWNVEMMTHVPQDIQWKREKGNTYLQFRLSGGAPGTASNDNVRRHGAPYWERNEVQAKERFGRNNPYKLSFRFRILTGFKGERETFFQIHSWNKECPAAYPQIMMKFDGGSLQIDALNRKKQHSVHKLNKKIDDIYNQWITLNMTAEPAGPDTVRYTFSGDLFDGKQMVVDAHLESCSNQWLKFGIYRPGKESGTNDLSIIDFDKVNVER